MDSPHISVLLDEVVELFKDIKDGVIVDCTLGYGGHSEAILKSNPHVKIIGCDRDQQAIDFSTKRLAPYGERVTIIKAPFSSVLSQIDSSHVRGVLADIGVSSLQLDHNDRGFGFDSDVLDMRMDKASPLSAYGVVNNYSQGELEEIFYEYGELTNAKMVAQKIVENRPINSAKELSALFGTQKVMGRKLSIITLIFQAIRIEVNDELGELNLLLDSIESGRLKKCKVGIISFHSLEDRIVKRTFKLWQRSCICNEFVQRCECGDNHAIGKILTKKAIEPSKSEIKANPRSRSSKLRAFYVK